MTSMFSPKTPPPAAAPEPRKPAPMPDESSPAVMEARRRALLQAAGRSGRSSTILTGIRDNYSGTTLGGQ
jgi:hypothetical protein